VPVHQYRCTTGTLLGAASVGYCLIQLACAVLIWQPSYKDNEILNYPKPTESGNSFKPFSNSLGNHKVSTFAQSVELKGRGWWAGGLRSGTGVSWGLICVGWHRKHITQ